jgi:glycosyltransferase involved in cell wall biosynthesis/SAM-dependent methyltransferase
MRLAFFSPMPPAKSGIADYSAALLEPLARLTDVEVFSHPAQPFDPARFDVALYQIGNNEYHAHAYETALAHPGVVVVHEANLHHLLCDLTIRRNNWDAYVAEAEYNGGAAARAYAERVRALEAGPDYEGLPMLRRLLESSKAAIAHSSCVADELRRAGFDKPIAVIPHGAWLPEPGQRMPYRTRLGIDEKTPLIGIFGYLKPYKRIAESLRAFKRLTRLVPDAKMILVGEPHPEFPLASLLRGLELEPFVRVLGFTPMDDFMGYLDACDIVLNLRYPTVGESSGTLLRALGLGKAVLVSDIGSFCEFPDDVVLKVPVDAQEENLIFEYLNTLVSRPALARALGSHAREWVGRECSWPKVARQYLEVLEAVRNGVPLPAVASPCVLPAAPTPLEEPPPEAALPPSEPAATEESAAIEAYLKSWSPTPASDEYLDIHLRRLRRTLELTPPGGPDDRILEMGAYLQITPALRTKLGYGEVRGCYLGPAGNVDHKRVVSIDGEAFECDIDLFNAEKDRFPYPDGHFATVLCCELLEHLADDPMAMMLEINRVLRPGGHLLITTPNIGSLRAIRAILTGYHPGFFPAYLKPIESDEARHAREYTPGEILRLYLDSGFEMVHLETGPFRDQPHPEDQWIHHLLERYLCSTQYRGDGIYALGRKTGPVQERYPDWLYH